MRLWLRRWSTPRDKIGPVVLHTQCVYNVGMARRINIMLPEPTLRAIDRLVRPGQRSRFIDRAVQHYVASKSQESLEQRLKAAAIRDRDIAVEIADDWKAVDQEQWQKLEQQEQRPAATGRKKV